MAREQHRSIFAILQ